VRSPQQQVGFLDRLAGGRVEDPPFDGAQVFGFGFRRLRRNRRDGAVGANAHLSGERERQHQTENTGFHVALRSLSIGRNGAGSVPVSQRLSSGLTSDSSMRIPIVMGITAIVTVST